MKKNESFWKQNSRVFEKYFEDVSSNIAGSSKRLRGKADRLIRTKLDDYINRRGSIEDVHIVVSFLVTLKKVSTEMVAWRKQINEEINKFLLQLLVSKRPTGPEYRLAIGIGLQKIEGEDSPTAKRSYLTISFLKRLMNTNSNKGAHLLVGLVYIITRVMI